MIPTNFAALAQRMLASLALALAAGGVLAAPAVYRLHVDGLACPFCAYGIEKKLGALDGVQHLETNIADGTVTVTMQDGVALGEAAAAQAVRQAGFTLRRFEPVRE
jgi:mercuric ion binding protein